MNHLKTFAPRRQPSVRLALVLAAVCFALAVPARAQDAKAAPDAKAAQKSEKKKLSGADLYAIHCNRCHPERYPTERTATQWKTIMLHMRVRANLPAEQAKTILKYLQEDSGKP
jgi:hypothetical protein